jgi:cation diffusion facilitator family transporter
MSASSSTRVIIAALIGNTLIAVTKFIAAAITGSSAMLSEGIHSLVDTGNQILLLYGLKASRRAPDERFPFGYGKEIYFWSFVVAILIFAVGAGVSLYEGILRVMNPEPVEHVIINYVVLVLAMLFEGGAWYFALKAFSAVKGKFGYIEAVQRGKDPSMFVVLFEDSAAMLGLAVALIATVISHTTGMVIFDGIASIVIGLILGATAIWLAYETKGLLIGESANTQVVEGIRAIAADTPHIDHLNEVLTMHMGPDFILVTVSIDFEDAIDADTVERTTADIDRRIKQVYPQVKRVFIEAEKRHQHLAVEAIREVGAA